MTLIEVMLALALFAILALFVVSVVRSVLGLWQAGERRGRGDLVFASAIEQVRSDFRALHHGPRGWLLMDDWEVFPAQDDHPAWRLPRIRFLARGASLADEIKVNRGAVEVAWVLVPENPTKHRLSRLIRVTLPESDPRTLRNDTTLQSLLASGLGLIVLDGVAMAEWKANDPVKGLVQQLNIPAQTPFHFPPTLSFSVERVQGNARQNPPRLDDDLGPTQRLMRIRGSLPLKVPQRVLVEQEWIAVGGNFPQLTIAGRGLRGGIPQGHDRGEIVWIPETSTAEIALPARGRRVLP